MSETTLFYFAFGSNMDPKRFGDRVGPWKSTQKARLDGYRLRFARELRSEGGGGAVVDVTDGESVDGVLFEITEEQMAAMDREEFDPSRDTEQRAWRETVTVETVSDRLSAEIYLVKDDGKQSAPSSTYLNHILDGMRAADYDETSLDRVRAAAQRAAEAEAG